MQAPTRADYVRTYFTLFECFQQERERVVHYGHPFKYADQVLIVFFSMMSVRRITAFKAQHRWLMHHLHLALELGFEQIPVCTTLSRRYQSLYPILQAFIAFVSRWAEALHPQFDSRILIEDASLAESQILEEKQEALFALDPQAIVGDNAYFKAMRVRSWAAEGVLLLTPAAKWQNGRYAAAYHRFIAKAPCQDWLKCRKTAIEPIFDLFAKVLGTDNNQKQLPLQRLPNVRSFLCLGVLTVQIAMIVNSAFGLPLRQISILLTAFS